MKFGILTIGTLTLGATIAGYSGFSGEKQEDSLQSSNGNLGVSSQVIQQKQKTMGVLLDETTQLANKTPINAPTERDELLYIIDKNINLKMRIQSTKWYRDFLSGTLAIEEARKNITDALFVENELERNPTFLMKLQYTAMWQGYIRGDIPPSNIAYGEIPAIHFIEEFQKNNTIIFGKIERNPIFYKNEKGEETTFSERNNIIVATMKTEEFLQANPSILSKVSQYGYSLNDIYMGQSSSNNVYGQIDAVVMLGNQGNFDPVVWKQFQESDTGAQYRSGTIDPREAFRYINDLMIRAYP